MIMCVDRQELKQGARLVLDKEYEIIENKVQYPVKNHICSAWATIAE